MIMSYDRKYLVNSIHNMHEVTLYDRNSNNRFLKSNFANLPKTYSSGIFFEVLVKTNIMVRCNHI